MYDDNFSNIVAFVLSVRYVINSTCKKINKAIGKTGIYSPKQEQQGHWQGENM
jgi:hypothetical protein